MVSDYVEVNAQFVYLLFRHLHGCHNITHDNQFI